MYNSKMKRSTFTYDKAKSTSHGRIKNNTIVAPQVRCFICDEIIKGKGVSLLMTSTPYSNTGLPSKIGELMGDGFMVLVAVTDMLCKRCSSLLNHLDKLEFDLDIVKKALTGYLKLKYNLKDEAKNETDYLRIVPNPLHEDKNSNYAAENSEDLEMLNDDSGYIEAVPRRDVKPSLSEIVHSILSPDDIKLEKPDSARSRNVSTIIEDADPDQYRLLKRKRLQQNWNTSVKQPLDVIDENQQPEQSILKLYKCTVCSYKSPHLDSYMAHLNLHQKKVYYKCSECLQRFDAQEDVEHHVLQVHGVPDVQYESCNTVTEVRPPTKIYECNVCHYRNHDKRAFSLHLKKHIKKELFYCALCPKRFRHKITLKKHLTTHETFKCGLCSITFQNKASLVHHFKFHRDEEQEQILEENYEEEYLLEEEEDQPETHELIDLVEEEEEHLLEKPALQPTVDTEEMKNTESTEILSAIVVDSDMVKKAEYDQVEVLMEEMHAEPPEPQISEIQSIENGVVTTKSDQNNVKEEKNILEPEIVIENVSSEQFQIDGTIQSSVIDDKHIKEYLEDSSNYLDESQSDLEQDENVKKEEVTNKSTDLFSFLNDGSLAMEQAVKSDEIVANEGESTLIKEDNGKIVDEVKTEQFEVPPKAKVKRKIYACLFCGLRTPSDTHMKRHIKCHVALQKKTYQCHICERVLTTRSNLKRHLSNHENCPSGEIQCNICFRTLTDRLHLRHHLEANHPETHQCPLCDRWFVSKKLCRAHEMTHPERAAHRCKRCGEGFATPGRLKTHQEVMHSDPDHAVSDARVFKCHICHKILTTYHNLKRHLRNHERTSGPVNCTVCDARLPDRLRLRQHTEECHPDLHQCSFCHKVFTSKKCCKVHELTHPERLVHKCDKCDKRFLTEARLKRHEAIMHRDPHCRSCGKEISDPLKLLDHERRHERHKVKFSCPQCPKMFCTSSGLKYHMSVHTGKYAVYCEICGKGLHSEVVLEEHKATHTKEVRYMCELCGRKFSSNSTYRMHRLWHDNPLPYSCNVCGRKFKHTSILAVHKRRAHTGERPYKCPYCTLTFSVSSTLNKHVILHTKQYPHRCQHCGKGFTTRTKIARHLARAHNDFEMINTKKKRCEYKMVLMPSELKDMPQVDMPMENEGAAMEEMKKEQEEIHVAMLNLQEQEEVHMTTLHVQQQQDNMQVTTLHVQEGDDVGVAILHVQDEDEEDVGVATLGVQEDDGHVTTLDVQEQDDVGMATLHAQEEDDVGMTTLHIQGQDDVAMTMLHVQESDEVHVTTMNVQEQEEVHAATLQVLDQEAVVETTQPSLFTIFQQDLPTIESG